MVLTELNGIASRAAFRFDGVLGEMHRDRKRVFVDGLRWDVPVLDRQFEVDQFDDENATYLIVADFADEPTHLASVRLLPSTRPHILGDIFPELCMGPVPTGEDVMEITRLCMSPAVKSVKSGMMLRRELAIGLTEYALLHDIRTYTLVCLAGHLPQVLACGWDVEPLGLPLEINNQTLSAARINITPATLSLLRAEKDRAAAGGRGRGKTTEPAFV